MSTDVQTRVQLLLPFAEREYVDTARAAKILGVSRGTVARMAASGYIQMIEFRARAWHRVRYQSIVDWCDKLRAQYGILDLRPPLPSPLLRYRDAELLPFPLADTLYLRHIIEPLGYSHKQSAARLCEEGRLLSYRLHPAAAWRIHAPSFQQYLAATLSGVSGGPRAYRASVS
jgi:hypothetical protein